MSLEWPIPTIKAVAEVTTNEGELITRLGEANDSSTTSSALASYFVSTERLASSLKLGSVEQVVTHDVVTPDTAPSFSASNNSSSLVTIQEKIVDKQADSWLLSHVAALDLQQAFLANEIVVEHIKESLI